MADDQKTLKSDYLTLQKAIEMGEYQPEFLEQYEEFRALSRHAQFQLIRKAVDNREKQLLTQWAELNNVIDYRLKPEIQPALRALEAQRMKVVEDKEKLYIKYALPEE